MKKCECGCGEPATLAKWTDARWGYVKGQPLRFCRGHQLRVFRPRYRVAGTLYPMTGGDLGLYLPTHPHANAGGYVLEHLAVVSAALGGAIPERAEVHHVNKIKTDNRPSNLVLCEDAAYHGLLHRRQRALDECGNANWIRCMRCKRYSAPEHVRSYLSGKDRQPKRVHIGSCRQYHANPCRETAVRLYSASVAESVLERGRRAAILKKHAS